MFRWKHDILIQFDGIGLNFCVKNVVCRFACIQINLIREKITIFHDNNKIKLHIPPSMSKLAL